MLFGRLPAALGGVVKAQKELELLRRGQTKTGYIEATFGPRGKSLATFVDGETVGLGGECLL